MLEETKHEVQELRQMLKETKREAETPRQTTIKTEVTELLLHVKSHVHADLPGSNTIMC